MEQLTYKGHGVDCSAIDPFKILCQQAGLETEKVFARSIRNVHIQEYHPSRGESAYLQKLQVMDDCYIAHVHKGLGTKNLVADAMFELTGKTYYDSIAQDTVAMIVNDMITLGALPYSVAMHLSVGESDWFKNQQRVTDLVEGWKNACISAGAIWGCSETPTLKDVIMPGAAELSGSAYGIVIDEEKLFETAKIEHGDVILFIESSGIHASGLTLARKIAGQLPAGYMTPIESGGQSYGEALLEPTTIYVPFIEDWLHIGCEIHYAVNITDDGWRNLMRAPQPFQYVVDRLPWQNPIFDFIQKQGNITDKEMYGNYNMGVGFALFVPKETAHKIIEFETKKNSLPRHAGGHMPICIGGHVKKSHTKSVVIVPKNIVFQSDTLAVR